MESKIRILHLEDNARDAELIHSRLAADGLVGDIKVARGKTEFETALGQGGFDLILTDYNLPDYDGASAIVLTRGQSPETPVIVVSGTIGEDEAVRCLKLGAADYLLKHRLERLPAAVRNALQAAQEYRGRINAERALRENEQRFRLLAENSDHVFWFYGGDSSRTLYVSPAFERIWGIPTERLHREPHLWRTATHPGDRQHVDSAFMAWARGKNPTYDVEYRVIRPDGSVRWVHDTGTLVRDGAGQIAYMGGIARDITARLNHRERLRESEERFRLALERSPIGMALVAPDGRWLFVNRALCQIVGYSMEELRALDFQSISPPDDVNADLAYIRQMLERGIDHYTLEKRYLHKNGHVVWVTLCVSLVCHASGEPRYFLAQIQDISERKQAEQMLLNLNAELERRVEERTQQLAAANKELESFSYSVSHDLRAPLRAIDGFSLALLEDYADKLDEEGVANLKRVRTGSQRMGNLIDDLLSLSRVTRKELLRKSINLSALARTVAAELAQSEPGRQVDFDIADGIVSEGDEGLLRVALENLLGNAWKFTAKRSQATIEFGALPHNGRPAYFVRDNGAGFDMAHADKLFGAFQRLHGEAEFPGTGIGLATVQRVVRRHGGEVWAESAPDAGATFYFTLLG